MANKFVRNITGIKDILKQKLSTNNQNDLLSDKEDAYIRNKNEYHCLTDNVKSVNGVKADKKNHNEAIVNIGIESINNQKGKKNENSYGHNFDLKINDSNGNEIERNITENNIVWKLPNVFPIEPPLALNISYTDDINGIENNYGLYIMEEFNLTKKDIEIVEPNSNKKIILKLNNQEYNYAFKDDEEKNLFMNNEVVINGIYKTYLYYKKSIS